MYLDEGENGVVVTPLDNKSVLCVDKPKNNFAWENTDCITFNYNDEVITLNTQELYLIKQLLKETFPEYYV